MPRNLSAAMITQVGQAEIHLFHLIKFGFSTPEYITNAYTDVSWNSQTWLAAGNLIRFENIKESADLRVNSVDIVLSGANQANVALALTENYTNREIDIYVAVFNTSYQVVADPVNIFPSAKITNFSFREDPTSGSAELIWTAASHWADFDRIAGRRTNYEDQQFYYPGDEGFKFASQVAKDLKWGAA